MKRGFTLVETIVVFSILLVIGIVSTFNFRISEMKSRDVRRKNDMKALADALYKYQFDYGEFPASEAGKVVSCGKPGFVDACEWGLGQFGEPEGTIYMERTPGDPTPQIRQYKYVTDVNKTKFKLYASLENMGDSEITEGIDENCGGSVARDVLCNWALVSNNTTVTEKF